MTLVRATLSALAETSGFDAELIDDLKTAVSEACNNVVLHAYPGGAGPLILSVVSGSGGVKATVEDRGTGIRQVAASEERMGVGLAVISALADRAEFQTNVDGGTTVRMSFKRSGPECHRGTAQAAGQPQALPDIGLEGDVVAWLSPASSVAPVLGRLVRAVAATSHFTLAAVCDLHAVSGALGAYAERHTAGGPIGFSIDASPRRLQLTGGPFLPRAGAGTEQPLPAELHTLHGAEWDLVQIELVDRSRDRAGDSGGS